MDLGERLAGLDPLQQTAVTLVYFEGRTVSDVARLLAIERLDVGAALARAFEGVARWVMDEDRSHAAAPDREIIAG